MYMQTLCDLYADTDCVMYMQTLCDLYADTDRVMFADTRCTASNVFRCFSGTRCYDLKYRCDGSTDCTHGDDEMDCGKYDIVVTVSNTVVYKSSSSSVHCTKPATHSCRHLLL